jgi:hypothetical protein
MNTTYLCGEAGCLALGVAFVAAILILVLIGWIYVMWQEWAVRHLEDIEQDIRRERYLKAFDQYVDKHSRDDEDAA